MSIAEQKTSYYKETFKSNNGHGNDFSVPALQKLLSGNEAIAQGAWEAGVHVATGYPGTPSTEILENLSQYSGVNCEWSTNEKVALEIGIGSSLAGARVLVTMKHVGLNVAADPFFSAGYTGVNGGLVIVSADDPGMHSSQNEQDSRLLAAAARIPILEPSTPQEARDHIKSAFALSENFDTPVLIRMTTRIAHGKALVKIGDRIPIERRPYSKNAPKYVLLPSNSRQKHTTIESHRIPKLKKEAGRWVTLISGSKELAFITSGASFCYVTEAFPHAAVMKLGMCYPLPQKEILSFAKNKKRIVVVEELEPFLETRIASWGIKVEGKNCLPRCGELSVNALRASLDSEYAQPKRQKDEPLPPRPPVMCAGCSHRGTFYALRQLDTIVAGDIGCYTLGALAPLDAIDCSINMGASISMAQGMEKVMTNDECRRLVSIIGDSTFFHSGITALVDVVYNSAHTTTIVLDNHTSAMTGHQAHPGAGESIKGQPAKKVDIVALSKSIGVDSVRTIDPYDLPSTLKKIDEEIHSNRSSVIVADAPCALKTKRRIADPVKLDAENCTQCFACTQLGCPAIEINGAHLQINPLLCIACGQCGQVCSDCNAGLDIPWILELMHQERYREAFDAVMLKSPFPAIAARVCPHPCEHEINALGHHQAQMQTERYPYLANRFSSDAAQSRLSIRRIEHFLGDFGLKNVNGDAFQPKQVQHQKVAIIGAGPSGLSAAWQLRRLGYTVTVFDKQPKPGGMMRYGIPDFRLPRTILDAELARLSAIGIDFQCKVQLGKDMHLPSLTDEYDAVILAVGDGKPKKLTLEGSTDSITGVVDGLDFLRDFNCGHRDGLKGSVAVIGGGDTAIDCARSAKRLGADVTIYYRRDRCDMPAQSSEFNDAQSEGIRFEFRALPKRVISTDGKVTELVLTRTHPISKHNGPAHRFFKSTDEEFRVNADKIILAVGEEPELNFLKKSGVHHDRGIRVKFTGATSRAAVFACGDAAFGYGTVTQAIATGRRVAEAVHAFLKERKKGEMVPIRHPKEMDIS